MFADMAELTSSAKHDMWRVMGRWLSSQTENASIQSLIDFDHNKQPSLMSKYIILLPTRYHVVKKLCRIYAPTFVVFQLFTNYHLIVVSDIGCLFEATIWECSNAAEMKLLKELQKVSDVNDVKYQDSVPVFSLKERHRNTFYMSALITINRQGVNISQQLFMIQTILQFRGLSMDGIGLLSSLGIGTSRSTFKRQTKCAVAKHADMVQR
jgi:hypothetical protein